MLMFRFLKFLVVGLVLTQILSGCSSHGGLITKEELDKHSASTFEIFENNDEQYKMIQLDSGIVIYQDKSQKRTPAHYKNKKFNTGNNIHFGPDDVEFKTNDIIIR